MHKMFPNLMKTINLQVHESQQTPRRRNMKGNNTMHHNQIAAKCNFKKIIIVGWKKKRCIFYKETKIGIVADFCKNHAGQRTTECHL